MNTEFDKRISALQSQLRQQNISMAAIAPSANMVYLTGFAPHQDERPCALLVTPDATAFVSPELNAEQVEAHTTFKTIRWADEVGPHAAFEQALKQLGQVGVESLAVDNTMRADYLLLILNAAKPKRAFTADSVMGPLRLHKSEEEIRLLKRSAMLADRAVLAGFEALRVGMTERELAEVIVNRFREGGAETTDFALIASGPNGAFPHHSCSDRKLERGDVIIIDIGAGLNKYKSDITRCFCLGEPSAEVRKVYEIVKQANDAGRKAARAGALARDVDYAARQVITAAGYGPEFTHRTGHGIGLETHEGPWITSASETVLDPGMAFSVEPGIYLNGRFGIRIEDIVVITDGECLTLSELDHEFFVKEV